MSRYAITAIVTNQLECTDGGGWQMLMGWRKTIILDHTDPDVSSVSIADEPTQENIRGHISRLVNLLNSREAPTDERGYLLWDRCYALSNRQCWQWELIAAHSTCLIDIMRAAGIDWPDNGTMPDIIHPQITINLSIQ